MANIARILLAALIFWVWMVLARSYYICEVKGLCRPPEPSIDSLKLENLPRTLKIVVSDIVVLENYPEFVFDYSSTAAVLTDDHKKMLEKLGNMLKSQPKSRVMITGFYLLNEKLKNPDRYSNLGLARAMTIADKLMYEHKIAPEQIMTSGELLKDSTLAEPIKFELLGFLPIGEELQLQEEDKFKEQWADSMKTISYNGILAFFEPNVPEMKTNEVFEEFSDSLASYLKAHPKTRLQLIGHSDTHFSESEAQRCGLQYAKLVEGALKKKGIKARFEIKSKGKSTPLYSDILPDKTPDALAVMRNRRVEIVLLKK